jgi:endonuclease I
MNFFSTLRSNLFLALCLPVAVWAQPSGYYNAALGLNGTALKTSLHNIITNHNAQNYPLWSFFSSTDSKPSGKVWDIYSDNPTGPEPYEYTFGSDQCGTYNGEGDCYNHEHSWPQSYFSSAMPAVSDLFHIYPTDGEVNAKHGNFPYGKVNNPTWTSQAGSKLGPIAVSGAPSGTAFEPRDEYKGDIARSYFYMCVRYYTEDAGWSNWDMANGADLKPWAITMLLQWHNSDPVSTKEIDRNNAIYSIQNNRNPFIDYPTMADCIWGSLSCAGLTADMVQNTTNSWQMYPNPAREDMIVSGPEAVVLVTDAMGRMVARIDHKDRETTHVNVAEWRPGVYWVKIWGGKTSLTRKLIVE